MLLRRAARELEDTLLGTPRVLQTLLLMYQFLAALVGRFLVATMQTPSGMALVVLGNALEELNQRLTITARDRFVYRRVLGHTEEEAKAQKRERREYWG